MINVAIDGPSGAGKSTLARRAARELGYVYVDTGAFYRALALLALEEGLDPTGEDILPLLPTVNLEVAYDGDGEQQIFLNGRNVSDQIRGPEVSQATSQISAVPAVRQWLLDFQRQLARKHHVIMDGRDIGTVVLPEAQIKIFLTATPEERATRRYKEYLAKGEEISYNKVLEDLKARDKRDSTREIAPLKQADDAVLLDSTRLDFDETLAEILKIIGDRKETNVL